jgi:hypothetical protein
MQSGELGVVHRRVSSTSSTPRPVRWLSPLPTLGVALVLVACAATTYRPLQTSGDGVFEGRGGSMSVEDGMDVWDYGAPPGRYRVLGVIEDARTGGAFAPLNRARSDVVSKAREVGGQALIRVNSRAERFDDASARAGEATPAQAASGAATVRRQWALFLVIQYIDRPPRAAP